jgi:carboxymethylenebutenolidase
VIAPDYLNPRFIAPWPETHDPATEKDVEFALDFLKTLPQVRSDKVCVVGISRGGYHAVLLAARRPEVACIVTYYGHMVNPNAPEPWQMYRYAPEVDKINVPSLFIVGEEEFELRRIGIRRAFYALLKRGVPVDIVMYPHARRAFDFRAEQREEEKLATADAARRTAAFIRSVLQP